MSNQLVMKTLSQHCNTRLIEEESRFSNRNYLFFKIVDLLKLPCKLLGILGFRPHYIYTNLPSSLLGVLKVVYFLLISRLILLSKPKVIVHIHRGDFEEFYETNILYKKIIDLTFKFIHKVIVLSPSQVSFYKERFNVSVEYLHNTVPVDFK
ncbi:hypothetical protein REH81_27710, partial [Vibrio rotiferianus]